jgi:uncharacterized protein YqiB (DUF1249 family)
MSRFDPQEKSYWLAKLCEANYERLNRLIPGLGSAASLSAVADADADGKPTLHLRLLEHSPYTVTLELSHRFNHEPPALREPAVKIRVYLDARAAEVLSDRERPNSDVLMQRVRKPRELMDHKWTLNYFLSQWLEHCLACNYRFGLSCAGRESCEEAA